VETIISDLLKELSQQFRTVWDIYIKFYTAFLVFNMAGLGLVAEKVKSWNARKWIMLAFIFQNILSAITAFSIAFYSQQISDRAERLTAELVSRKGGPNDKSNPTFIESPFPGQLGYWSGVANGVSHAFFIVSWIAVCRMWKPREDEPDKSPTIEPTKSPS
jgi:hypothetical protein